MFILFRVRTFFYKFLINLFMWIISKSAFTSNVKIILGLCLVGWNEIGREWNEIYTFFERLDELFIIFIISFIFFSNNSFRKSAHHFSYNFHHRKFLILHFHSLYSLLSYIFFFSIYFVCNFSFYSLTIQFFLSEHSLGVMFDSFIDKGFMGSLTY